MKIHSSQLPNIVYQSSSITAVGSMMSTFRTIKNTGFTIGYFGISIPGGGKFKVLDYNIEPDLMVVEDYIIGYTSQLKKE